MALDSHSLSMESGGVKTISEQLASGLEKLGWVECEDRSKYRAFVHPNQTYKLFLGSHGALRAGKNASQSMSMGDSANRSTFWKRAFDAGAELTQPQTTNKMEK